MLSRSKAVRGTRTLTIAAALASATILGAARFARASLVTWDSSGTNPTAPVDGSGTWDNVTSDWSNPSVSVSADTTWNNANNDTAVIGSNNGAAGTITVASTGVIVGGITYNAATSGLYNVTGGGGITLGLAQTTVTTNVNGSLTAVLAGTGGLNVTGAAGTTLAFSTGLNTYTGGTSIGGVSVALGAGGVNAAISTPFGTVGSTLVLTNANILCVGSGSGGSISYAVSYNISLSGTNQINAGKQFTLGLTGDTISGTGNLIYNNNASSSTVSNIKGGFSGTGASAFTGTLETESTASGANIRIFANGGSFLGVPNGTLDMEGGTTAYSLTPQTNSGGNTFTYGALEGANASAILAGGTAGAPTDTIGGLGKSTTFAGSIQGNSIVTLTGGSLTLTNAGNSYTGATNINGGTLIDNGAITGSSATVALGATLAGDGSLTKLVTVNGTVAPGDGTGIATLTMLGGVTFGSTTGEYLDDVDAAGLSDLLNVTGNITLTPDDTLDVNVLDTTSGGPYTIATYTGTLAGTFGATDLPPGYSISYGTGSNSSITLVVPEPASISVLGLSGVLLAARRRRKA